MDNESGDDETEELREMWILLKIIIIINRQFLTRRNIEPHHPLQRREWSLYREIQWCFDITAYSNGTFTFSTPPLMWRGAVMVMALDSQSRGRELNPDCFTFMKRPWASCSHTRASVTKQYNLVLATGWWRSSAGKITVDLVESNGSLALGLWLVTCGLTA